MSILDAIQHKGVDNLLSTCLNKLKEALTPKALAKYEPRLEEWINTPGHKMYSVDADVGLFEDRGLGVLEVHIYFKSKGRKALDNASKIFEYVLNTEKPRFVICYIEEHLKNVRWFVRQFGFKSQGVIETPQGPSEYFVYSVKEGINNHG